MLPVGEAHVSAGDQQLSDDDRAVYQHSNRQIKLKRTTIFIESPNKERTRMPSKKEPGIAIPTNAPERQQVLTMMIITSNTALIMLFCSSLNMVFIFVDRSCENVYLSPSGQFLLVVSTTDCTRLTVSMMFSLISFLYFYSSDFSPASLAIEEDP